MRRAADIGAVRAERKLAVEVEVAVRLDFDVPDDDFVEA